MTLNQARARSARPHRQIIVLCDGTNANLTGGRSDSHVVTLAELLAAHPDDNRVVMYDPGVGHSATLPSAGVWDKLHRWWTRLEGLTQGRGVFENIVEGYAFIVRHWQPGDQIFVFGYSRGAFTARSIGGLVNRFGVVRAESESVYTTLLSIYLSGEKPGDPSSQQAIRLLTPEDARKVRIQFVGVWDTVEAVGVPPFRARIPVAPTLAGKRFMHVRQALSLDESRRMFKPRIYEQADGEFDTAFGDRGTVQQCWFRGGHADVGAQVPALEAGLGAPAFEWLVAESVACGGLKLVGDDGVELRDEAAVARAVAALPGSEPRPDGSTSRGHALLHDALHASSLWALTGLEPRETRHAAQGTAAMKEHPSVADAHVVVPMAPTARSSSAQVGRTIVLLFALFAMALAFVGAGQALSSGRVDIDVSQLFTQALPALDANLAFQRWQLLGPWTAARCVHQVGDTAINLCAARPALAWDLVLIVAYAYVGARIVSWAYGRCIGQRRVGDRSSRLWSALGLALPLAVVADVAENSLTLLTTSMSLAGMDFLPLVTGGVMALASVAKLAGIAGVLVLGIVAMLRRPAARVRRAAVVSALPSVAPAAVGFVADPKVPERLHAHDAPPEGQRVVCGDDGFERPVWANKKDDDS
jgi:Uncharacterized alpha/beta hydrolase domain (DUF2235)